MARKSGFVRRNNVMRRESLWIGGVTTQTVIAAASSAVLLLSLNAAALALRPFTVVRTRGVFYVRSDQVSANENYGCSMGNCVVSDQAVAIGVTAVPTPEAERSSDLWYVYEQILGQFAFTTGTGYRDVGHLMQFDSKAMRKVEDGQDIIVVLETPSTNDSGASIGYSDRTLIKLH